jgi:flagellar hook protein FlgE
VTLFSNLHTASSGLAVAGTSMTVIGDNIANVNTIGYKRGRASFADSFPVDVSYVHAPISIGTGAYVGGTSQIFSQGALKVSNNNLDMAISGNGFFAVRNGGEGIYYTRNGEFMMDKEGYVVTPTGMRLQGYQSINNVIQPNLGDIRVPLGDISALNTTEVTMTANLDADADDSTTPLGDINSNSYDPDGTGVTYGWTTGATNFVDVSTAAAEADFATSVAIYDTLGSKHDLTFVYEKTSTNSWTCYVLADASEVNDGVSVNSAGKETAIGSEGEAFLLYTLEMEFDTDGTLTNYTPTRNPTTDWKFIGAEDSPTLAFNFGLDANGDPGTGAVTQLASVSTVTSLDQNGYGVGNLTSVTVKSDGSVVGLYDNGQDMIMGQVSIAIFDSPTGLERMGGNIYRATPIPGEPSYGLAGEGGRGDIFGSSLEASNVDIEDEFVNMITAQRSYQANSRVMAATNELLRELVNLV